MRAVALFGILGIGCGRFGFDPLEHGDALGAGDDGDAPGGDGNLDAMPMVVHGQTQMNDVNAASIAVSVTFHPGTVFVVQAMWNHGSYALSISDSAGQLWLSTPSHALTTGCHLNLGLATQIFYAPIVASGSGTITITQPGAGNIGMFAVEYSGLAIPVTEDGMAGQVAGAASNLMTAGTMSTSRYDLIVAGFHDNIGSGTMTPGAGLTQQAIDTTAYALFADALVPAGSYPLTATLPGGVSDACWVTTAVALRAQ